MTTYETIEDEIITTEAAPEKPKFLRETSVGMYTYTMHPYGPGFCKLTCNDGNTKTMRVMGIYSIQEGHKMIDARVRRDEGLKR